MWVKSNKPSLCLLAFAWLPSANKHVVHVRSQHVERCTAPLINFYLHSVTFHLSQRGLLHWLHVPHEFCESFGRELFNFVTELDLHLYRHIKWLLWLCGCSSSYHWLCDLSGYRAAALRWQSILRPEFVKFATRTSFHALTDPVDVAAGHVVELAIIPDELYFSEAIFIGSVITSNKPAFHSA